MKASLAAWRSDPHSLMNKSPLGVLGALTLESQKDLIALMYAVSLVILANKTCEKKVDF